MANLNLDTKRTALLLMDFQQGIAGRETAAGVVQQARGALETARKAGLSVIHVIIRFQEGYPEVASRNRMFSGVQQGGRFGIGQAETQIVPELAPIAGEAVVGRSRVSAFFGSELDIILRSKGIDTLLLAGISTSWVVEGTAWDAVDRDYRVIALEDCCASGSVEEHQSAIDHVLRRIAEVGTSADLRESMA